MGSDFTSLSRKFFWILFSGVLFFFGVLTFFILQREKEIILNIHREEALTTATLLADDIIFTMLSRHPESVTDNIKTYSGSGKLKIGVVGPDGKLAFNTTEAIPLEYLRDQKERFVASGDEYVLYKPLPNDRTCHACHSPGDTTRGMLAIRSSMRGAADDIAATGKRILLFAVVIGLISEGFLLVILRRYILNPVKQLSEGAALLKAGRLDHRIPENSRDEIGLLASSFNAMADGIKQSHDHLEEAVQQRTTELRVIAELSVEVLRGDRSVDSIFETFLAAITGPIGFGFASLCLVDKETGLLSREFRKGIDYNFCSMGLSLAGEHPVAGTIREAKAVVRKADEAGLPEDTGTHVAIIPVLSHQRQRCREINLCTLEQCPAFSAEDDRCWLAAGTLCRSPQAVTGKEKIYGCLHCSVFPVLGVLIAGRRGGVSDSALHSLEILASEIASAVENLRLIEAKKQDISKLIRLHDISVESLQTPTGTLASSIVTSVTAFANMDAAVLWVTGEGGALHLADVAGIPAAGLMTEIPGEDSFLGRAIREDKAVETLRVAECPCIAEVAGRHGFLYAAAIPLRFKDSVFGCMVLFKRRDFLMTDSERAVTVLFASQAAAALNTGRLFSTLKAEKEFSDAIFNCAASGIMVLDREGRIIKVNAIGTEILRLDPLRAPGQKIVDLYPEMEGLSSFGMGIGREVSITCHDGTVIPLGFTNSPLYDTDDGRDGVIVLFRDLTEIKRLQSELRRKEHFEAMGRVLAGVAHEIRNPLFGISSIGQILEKEIITPLHAPLVRALLKETDRMKRLLEELLLYTRPSRLDLRGVDLNRLFEDLSHYIGSKRDDVTMSVKIPPRLSVRADNDKITQVFLNLLNNAVDAARSSISVAARKAGRQIEIEIADDGQGIRETDLQQIFEPFFTTKKGGTGLGLPISRKIVEDHSGSIHFISPEGSGATFIVTLPADEG